MEYKLITFKIFDEESQIVERINDDGSITHIPLVQGNADYERYLEWLADQ